MSKKQKKKKKVRPTANKLNPAWIRAVRDEFKEFLDLTHFPHPERDGTRGSTFLYPEWLIMLIAVLTTKCQIKSYVRIHAFVAQYWPILSAGIKNAPCISERQLRDRLKKICHSPRKPAAFIFQLYPDTVRPDDRLR